MNEFLILGLSIIPHELGHWLSLRIDGIKAEIKLRWFGIEVGGNTLHETTISQAFKSASAGIILGMIFLMIMNMSVEIKLIYLVMSSIDIAIITNAISEWKRKDKTMLEIAKLQIKEYEKEYNTKKR